MPIASVLAFWLVAALLIVVPGADWAFTISSAVRGYPVVAAVSGLVAGYAAMTLLVAGGVGALVAGAPAALSVLTFAGGGYLMWHGVATVIRPSAPAPAGPGGMNTQPAAPVGSSWRTLLRGVAVSGLNPKALLLFLALLPQFTAPSGSWPVAGQIGLLGGVFTVTCGVFYLVLGSFAAATLRARPGFARSVGRLSGGGMFLIGAGLIAEHLLG